MITSIKQANKSVDLLEGNGTKEESTEISLTNPLFSSLLAPTALQKIRPWFTPTTYRFLPYPLNYALIAGIPLVVPAVSLALGTLAYQKAASAIRIKKHFRDHEDDFLVPGAQEEELIESINELETRYGAEIEANTERG